MSLLLFLLLCHGLGALSARAIQKPLQEWFIHLRLPAWHPPGVVFDRVWKTLYTLMAVAGWRIQEHPQALLLWAVQLFFHQLWNVLFFGLRSPGLALLANAGLWSTLALCMQLFWPLDPWAALCLLPEWCWISFASLLNFETWRLNRKTAQP